MNALILSSGFSKRNLIDDEESGKVEQTQVNQEGLGSSVDVFFLSMMEDGLLAWELDRNSYKSNIL